MTQTATARAVDEGAARAAAARAVQVIFVERPNGPERLVCEAEIVFGAGTGPLEGMKLVGFSLWRSPEGEVYVTFPSRGFGTGTERRFFDYLRSVDGNGAHAKAVKAWILKSYGQAVIDGKVAEPAPGTRVGAVA